CFLGYLESGAEKCPALSLAARRRRAIRFCFSSELILNAKSSGGDHAGSMELCSFPDVPRRTHCKDAFISVSEKDPFQKPATLIVEKIFVPFVLHKLRYDHNNAASGVFFRKIENELNDGNDDK